MKEITIGLVLLMMLGTSHSATMLFRETPFSSFISQPLMLAPPRPPTPINAKFNLLLFWCKWQGIGYPKRAALPESDSVERVLLPGMTEFGKIPAVNR